MKTEYTSYIHTAGWGMVRYDPYLLLVFRSKPVSTSYKIFTFAKAVKPLSPHFLSFIFATCLSGGSNLTWLTSSYYFFFFTCSYISQHWTHWHWTSYSFSHYSLLCIFVVLSPASLIFLGNLILISYKPRQCSHRSLSLYLCIFVIRRLLFIICNLISLLRLTTTGNKYQKLIL